MKRTGTYPSSQIITLLLVATSLSALTPATAPGAVRRFLPPDSVEPATHRSFVRDNNPAGKRIVAWDNWYASDLKDNVTAGSVDLVFQQCFGGGFHNDIVSNGPANYTTASAARYDEVANNKDNVNAYFDIFKSLDNFTRAYRDSAVARPAEGVHDWFKHATEGGDGITKDPYAISGAGTGREHPVYWTPDPTASNVGPNNSRTFTHTAGAGNANQYAILVAWSKPENRHAVNMSRIYDMLRDNFSVPLDNIVILHGESALNDPLGDWSAVDSSLSYNAPIDGNTRRENWLSALKGDLFSGAGNRPDANDKLLIYNTGHGGHARKVRDRWTADNTASNLSTDAPLDLRLDGFSFDFSPNTQEASTIMNDPLGAGSVLVQLLLQQPINPDAQLNLPGVGMVSAGSAAVLSPSDVFYYNGVLRDSLAAYQFSVPFASLQSVAHTFEMQIDNLESSFLSNRLVSALSFLGGDQEHVYLFDVPEPATLALLVLWSSLIAYRRR